jgi:hypothetical protein
VQGPVGPVGATGAPGVQGPPGPAGLAGYQIVTSSTNIPDIDIPGLQGKEFYAVCPTGKIAIGGGHFTTGGEVRHSGPTVPGLNSTGYAYGQAWYVKIYNSSIFTNSAWAYAVCVNQ